VFEVGDHVGEHEIVAELGAGGMAVAFLARPLDSGTASESGDEHVVLKVIHSRFADDARRIRMLLDEARLTIQLRHPNVVRVDAVGEEDGLHYLVMEHVHGCTLAELMDALKTHRRRLVPRLAAAIAAQVLGGLHAAHGLCDEDGKPFEVVHRDVSPDNILLSDNGDVKLTDFGIARAVGRSEQTATGIIRGKPRYMAPEQVRERPLDRRTDVYALGIVLWEMLTMRQLLRGRSDDDLYAQAKKPDHRKPTEVVADLDPRLEAVVMRALSLEPDERQPSAAALAEELRAALPASDEDRADLSALVRRMVGDVLDRRLRILPANLATRITESQLGPAATPERTDSLTVSDPDQGDEPLEGEGLLRSIRRQAGSVPSSHTTAPTASTEHALGARSWRFYAKLAAIAVAAAALAFTVMWELLSR
jgi:serine/threonine-protein kinase